MKLYVFELPRIVRITIFLFPPATSHLAHRPARTPAPARLHAPSLAHVFFLKPRSSARCTFYFAIGASSRGTWSLKRRYRYILSLVVRLVIIGGAMSAIADQVRFFLFFYGRSMATAVDGKATKLRAYFRISPALKKHYHACPGVENRSPGKPRVQQENIWISSIHVCAQTISIS